MGEAAAAGGVGGVTDGASLFVLGKVNRGHKGVQCASTAWRVQLVHGAVCAPALRGPCSWCTARCARQHCVARGVGAQTWYQTKPATVMFTKGATYP